MQDSSHPLAGAPAHRDDAPQASAMTALVVEDDPVFAGALGRSVRALGEGWQAQLAPTVADALEAILQSGDDLRIALVDMHLPDGSGLEAIASLRERRPEVPALVISSVASERGVLDAISQGARGYLHKGETQGVLTAAMTQVMQGHYPISPSLARHLFHLVRHQGETAPSKPSLHLTPRETETLRCIARGLSYNETADHMGVSLSTVQSHIRGLYRKLEVRSQVQAVGRAREAGLL